MDRINDPSAPNKRFLDEDLLAGIQGTILRALWATGVQEELVGIIEALGFTPNGADNTLVLQAVSIIGQRQQAWRAVGVVNWIVPAGVYRIRARVWGGGGGGGGAINGSSAAIGGSGGGYAEGVFSVTPGTLLAITTGAGGLGGAALGGNGGNGGYSSVGSLISATGGGGSAGASNGIQISGTGAQGSGVGGAINLTGLPGQVGIITGNTSLLLGGGGGAAPFFASLSGSANAGGNTAGLPGCGGGGASAAAAGGAGSAGLIMIEF